MKQSHFVRGLLSVASALTLFGACADLEGETAEQPLTRLHASERSTAELGVATWEVWPDGADVRVVGRDAADARQVELIVNRDASAPDERVRIEAVFPDRGVFQMTRAGVVEDASSDDLQRLAANVYSDLGQGSASVVPDVLSDDGLDSKALAIGYEGVFHLSWNLWGYTRVEPAGGWCPEGRQRDYAVVRADYGAYSSVAWQTDLLQDCRVLVTMSVQNGHWDDFRWTVYTK